MVKVLCVDSRLVYSHFVKRETLRPVTGGRVRFEISLNKISETEHNTYACDKDSKSSRNVKVFGEEKPPGSSRPWGKTNRLWDMRGLYEEGWKRKE